MLPPPPRSTLFPYTTLFRSHRRDVREKGRWRRRCAAGCRADRRRSLPCDRARRRATGRYRRRRKSAEDRKSTRLNSSHVEISYAVFCLKKKTKKKITVRSNI